MLNVKHTLASRSNAVILELARLEVVGEQVASGVRFVARGRNAHRFLALDDAIDADMRGEVELAVDLDEVDVALALGNGLAALLAASLGKVPQLLDLLRLGIEAEHLGALVNVVRAEDVVDPAVAAGAHGVVAVMAQREPGVVGLGDDLLALVGVAIGHDRRFAVGVGAAGDAVGEQTQGEDDAGRKGPETTTKGHYMRQALS